MRKKNPRKDQLKEMLLEQGVPKDWARYFVSKIREDVKAVLKATKSKKVFPYVREGDLARDEAQAWATVYHMSIRKFEGGGAE